MHRYTFRRAFSSSRDLLTLENYDNIGILRFNDPKRLNALSFAMGEALEEKVNEINKLSDKIHAIVLCGDGNAFSAGGDLEFLQARALDTPSNNRLIMREFYGKFLSLRKISLPLIAALNGPAIGAGFCVSLFADFRIAATDAKLGFTFVNLGLHPGMAATHYLPQLIGIEKSNELLLTGKIITGVEAERIGLVSKTVEKENVLEESINLATQISSASPFAVRSLLRTLRMNQDKGLEENLQQEANAQAQCYTTQEYKEGLEAILKKTKSQFTKTK